MFDPGVGKIPRRKEWQPTIVFLTGKVHKQRSLAGCCPWGHKSVRRDLAIGQQKSDRERQISYDITFTRDLNKGYKWTHRQNINRLTGVRNKFIVTRGENKGGEGINWEFGINRYNLLYIKWTHSKVLLYNTGNYIQYLVINHNGKEFKKEHLITESLCCTPETNTIL